MKSIAHLFFGLAFAVSTVCAQSPREQLKQMVEQLQKAPNDNALREKIIRLAQEVKPAPVVPEEAVRHMARGAAAFKGAKSTADYQDAAKEFEQAAVAAPWLGDAYFNLGVAQDKAESHDAALRSLRLAQLASPASADIKTLVYEVEYRRDKALVASRAPDPARLQGIWVEKKSSYGSAYYQIKVAGDTVRVSLERFVATDSGVYSGTYSPGESAEYRLKAVNGEFNGVSVEGSNSRGCAGRESPARATISPDGREMTVIVRQMFGHGLRNGRADPTSCVESPQPERRFVLRKE